MSFFYLEENPDGEQRRTVEEMRQRLLGATPQVP
jgi:hypothetical protein